MICLSVFSSLLISQLHVVQRLGRGVADRLHRADQHGATWGFTLPTRFLLARQMLNIRYPAGEASERFSPPLANFNPAPFQPDRTGGLPGVRIDPGPFQELCQISKFQPLSDVIESRSLTPRLEYT